MRNRVPKGILVNYTGGDIAAALTPFGTLQRPGQQLRGGLGPNVPAPDRAGSLRGVGTRWNGRATLSAWHVNPYSYGAYSYWPTGYCHNYAGYEAMRQGNVHFAGEHCSIDFQGYMEGGAAEGQRAGTEVLGDYGLK